jgi:hypothetical protein
MLGIRRWIIHYRLRVPGAESRHLDLDVRRHVVEILGWSGLGRIRRAERRKVGRDARWLSNHKSPAFCEGFGQVGLFWMASPLRRADNNT